MTVLETISVAMVLVGAGFMFASIKLALAMFRNIPKVFLGHWKVLTGLMGFFFLGYVIFDIILVARLALPVELLSGVVFLGGAFFVFLIINLTRKTIASLWDREKQLNEANVMLETRVEERTAELSNTLDDLHKESEMCRAMSLRVDKLNIELSQILNTTSTAIRVIDKNFVITRANKPFYRLTGLTQGEVIGRKCYGSFANETCKDTECALKIILGGRNERLQFESEKVLRNGSTVHCLITAAPFRDTNGEIVGIVEDFRDISERIEAERQREELQTSLLHASKLESVGRLAAGISHEINTPIQYIGSNINFFNECFQDLSHLVKQLQIFIAGQKSEEALADYLAESRKALEEMDWEFLQEEIPTALKQTKAGIDRVSSIVLAMKEFSHPGSKNKSPVDLNRILQNTITVSSNEWKYAAELQADLDETLPQVACLSDEIGQVFLNIIVNAAHAIAESHSNDGDGTTEGSKGLIIISSRQQNGWVEVRIADNGSGMPEHIRKRVFEPFFTTKVVGRGTGQGLSIAHDVVVNKHGGTIEVESRQGEGTAFIIRLPVED